MAIDRDSDSGSCPVGDKMLGQLYRASKEGLTELIATVSPEVRAALAAYCYQRGHLREIGLAVASTCDEHDLVTWGGTAGTALFARSREATPASPALSHHAARQKITLSSGPLRNNPPIIDEPDHDGDAEPEPSAVA